MKTLELKAGPRHVAPGLSKDGPGLLTKAGKYYLFLQMESGVIKPTCDSLYRDAVPQISSQSPYPGKPLDNRREGPAEYTPTRKLNDSGASPKKAAKGQWDGEARNLICPQDQTSMVHHPRLPRTAAIKGRL